MCQVWLLIGKCQRLFQEERVNYVYWSRWVVLGVVGDKLAKTDWYYIMKGLQCLPEKLQLDYGQWRTLDIAELKKWCDKGNILQGQTLQIGGLCKQWHTVTRITDSWWLQCSGKNKVAINKEQKVWTLCLSEQMSKESMADTASRPPNSHVPLLPY